MLSADESPFSIAPHHSWPCAQCFTNQLLIDFAIPHGMHACIHHMTQPPHVRCFKSYTKYI